MPRIPSSLAVVIASSMLLAPAPGAAEHPTEQRAKAAIELGDVRPDRDLAPLVDALRRSRDVEERRDLVEAIADLGEADGESPNLVKAWLAEHATPVLLDVVENGHDAFLQGDAVFALRGMRVSRDVMLRAAALAEADPDAYVQSRGEIMRNFAERLPVEDASTATRETDPERRAAGIAYLDKRGIAVSTEALRDAAQRADADAVRALLDAGIAADTGAVSFEETPIHHAVAYGCHLQGADTDWLVESIRLLIDAGASLGGRDDNDNTLLLLAAHSCGPRVTELLAKAGAPLSARNGSGLSALGMAFVYQKLDVVQVLVDLGARLTPAEREMVESLAATPEAKALLRKASPVERSPSG